MFAEVVPVGIPLNSTFHYSIPPELQNKLAAGHLVEVSFGSQRAQGLVVTLSDDPPQGITDFKPVGALLDDEPVLTRAQIDLGYYLARRTLASLAECLALMLPPGLAKQGDTEYELSGQPVEPEGEPQFRLMQLLEQRGPLRGRQLDRALPRRNWKAAANTLVKRGALTRRPVLQPPSVHPKHVRTARLLVAPARLPFAKLQLRHSPHHADILDHLLGLWPAEPSLPDVLQRTRAVEADLDPFAVFLGLHPLENPLDLDPSLAIAITNLGNIRFRRHDQPGAEELYRRALEVDARQPEAQYNLGYLVLERGQPDAAIPLFHGAIQADPSFSDAYFNLAMAYEQSGHPSDAKTYWRGYIGLEPEGTWSDIARQHL